VRALHRDLERAAVGLAQGREVGEPHAQLGPLRELAPAALGGAVVAFALERGEHQRPVGAGGALVLDRVADRDQRMLRRDVGVQLGVAAARSGEDRGLGLGGASPDPLDRRAQRHPGAPLHLHRADRLDVLLGVAAMAARQPLRRRKAVSVLPDPQRGLGDPGALRHRPDREALRGAHAATPSSSRAFSRPRRTRLLAVPRGTRAARAISREVSPPP
jgi:hypothetical protein